MNDEEIFLDMMVDSPEKEAYISKMKAKKEETQEEFEDRVYGNEYSKWILRYRVEIDRRCDFIIYCRRKLEEYKTALDNTLIIRNLELRYELDCIDQMYKSRIEEVIHDSALDCENRIFDGFSRLSQLSRMRDLACDLWHQDKILLSLDMIFIDLKIRHTAKLEYCEECV